MRIQKTSSTTECITKFKPENEKIEVDLELVHLFFQANGIQEDKQVPGDW